MKIETRLCLYCKLDISYSHLRRKYCNNDCYNEYRIIVRRNRSYLKKTCRLCGKKYLFKGKGEVSSSYCSKDHHYLAGIIRRYGNQKEIYKIWIKSHDCKICKSVFKSNRDKHVDHDHKTGKVRGILCNNCNSGIGYLKEDRKILINAIEYLQSSKIAV